MQVVTFQRRDVVPPTHVQEEKARVCVCGVIRDEM